MSEKHTISAEIRQSKRILPGQRFNRLVVLEEKPTTKHGRYYLCRCDCGNLTTVGAYQLKASCTKSCGCYKREYYASLKKHGMSESPEYSVWKRMRARCKDQTDPAYENYGGRGITVCERWESFAIFIADMGKRPSKAHSIERIDNNGSYCPENCKWALRVEQQNNMRSNRILEFKGVSMTVAQWARHLGVPHYVLSGRVKRGWSTEEVLTTPHNRRNFSETHCRNGHEFNKDTMTFWKKPGGGMARICKICQRERNRRRKHRKR